MARLVAGVVAAACLEVVVVALVWRLLVAAAAARSSIPWQCGSRSPHPRSHLHPRWLRFAPAPWRCVGPPCS